MIKIIKRAFFIVCTLILFFSVQPAKASNNFSDIYFFYGEGCPHCAEERDYLFNVLLKEYPDLKINEYEIYSNKENFDFLKNVSNKLGASVGGVPFLVIGDNYFVGYTKSITSEAIKQTVQKCYSEGCLNPVSSIIDINIENNNPEDYKKNTEVINFDIEKNIDEKDQNQDIRDENSKKIKIPVLGEINIMSLSLPLLTIVMGALDGFNPCAMWTLLFLISLLLGVKEIKRRWILGIVFIVASASVYFIFMSAWLNLILFLGFVAWIRLLMGFLALLGGGYSIKEFIFNKENGCKVIGGKKRQKVFEKMKLAIQENSLFLAMLGIIILAFAVNLVELICSAGFPAIYTQVLAINNIAEWHRYL